MISEYKKEKFEVNKFVIILLLILFIWFIGSSIFGRQSLDGDQLFIIETGESVNSIADRLKEDNFITSIFVFKSYLQLTDKGSQLKAGEHYIATDMSVKEIVNELIISSAHEDLRITLIEGWTNNEIADYLESSINISGNDFLSAASRNYTDYSFLPRSSLSDYLQGYLFPDTYRILPNATPENIINKLLGTFEEKVYSPLAKDIAKSSMSLHEILTLASIIEMEVRNESDRKLVADLFLRRLSENYPLQSDATVNYVTKSGRAQSTIKDTKIDSPYNTYKYAGLPPGPIGNPSLSSIKAVLYPMPNSYYFFLTTKDDGRVIYGRTYDEHLDNKAKYLD